MSIWKEKVAPVFKFNKIFDKDGKKAAAAEFVKTFNKEEISKEIEEKREELAPKVTDVYEASPVEIKNLLKDKKAGGKLKKYPAPVTKFLEDLSGIDFPGAKSVSEAVAKSGVPPLAGPIAFIFEKVATFVVKEEPPKAEEAVAAPEEAAATTEAADTVEEKKEEAEAEAAEEKKEEEAAAAADPEPEKK